MSKTDRDQSHGGEHEPKADSGHEEAALTSFVPDNSLYDQALSGLALLTGLGLIVLLALWFSQTLPEPESALKGQSEPWHASP
jgi:hypothetical protein